MLDIDYMIQSFPKILSGVPVSLMIAFVAIFFGLIIGLGLALVRIYNVKVLRTLAAVYVSFFRGTPLLVQIFLCYYGLPIVLRSLLGTADSIQGIPAIFFIYISLSLNVAAYLSETIRGAILAVPKGQLEAAHALGMNRRQTLRRILLPQALKIALPNFSNTFISILKDTSLAFTISVPEIVGQAKIIAGRTSKFFEVYIIAALLYWALCFLLEQGFKIVEKRLYRNEGTGYVNYKRT